MKKITLITGASRGIGAATAILAAGRDYYVYVNYLKKLPRQFYGYYQMKLRFLQGHLLT